MENNKIKTRERFLIVGMTSFFLILFSFIALTPRLLAQNKTDEELQENIMLFQDVLEYVQENYVDEEKTKLNVLVEGALKGLLEALDDPYSMYLTADDMSDMEETTTGKFGGVGLFIFKGEKGVEVARPIEGTPAYKAGIHAGDTIIAVDEKSTLDLSIDEVVKMLKGLEGTKVVITILRGEAATFDVTLERAMIELPTVTKAIIKQKIGYMEVHQFTPITYQRIDEAITYFFKDNKCTSLIIDMRSNPGGLLSSVIDIGSLFFSTGQVIVSTKSRDPFEDRVYKAKGEAHVKSDIPIVVLIDKYTASAAEILTGALKDTKRAYVIGQKSYGKGSVQQIRYVGEGGLRLTIAKYFTPNNISINGIGIEPDKTIVEEKATKEEEASMEKLITEKTIEKFVEKNPKPTDKQVSQFVDKLKKDGFVFTDRYIRKMIRNAVNKTNDNPPVYDLDFDLELQEAVKYIEALK